MKKTGWLVLLSLVLLSSNVAATSLDSDAARVGYAIGMNIGLGIKMQEFDIDPQRVADGFLAAYKGEQTLLTEAEMAQILTAFQQQMHTREIQKMAADIEANSKKSRDFLAANAKKKGVVTRDSGLQYRVITSGKGKSPGATSTVEVHYRGKLVDGTEFDSSYSRGETATFPVGNVIPGWTEALQLMKEGDKWELAIPAELAYGDQGAPPVIPPSSALVFEVELIKVQ